MTRRSHGIAPKITESCETRRAPRRPNNKNWDSRCKQAVRLDEVAIWDLSARRMIVVVDDEDRENGKVT
jgi:hypothetical protein